MEILSSFMDSTPDGFNPAAFLVFLLVTGIIGFGIVLSIQASRIGVARKTARAAGLGFEPVPHPDPRLEKTILDLYRRTSNQRLDLRRVFHRASFDGDLFIFDVEDPTGEDTSVVADSAVAMVCPGAGLPFFSIHPRVIGEGFAIRIANRILDWTANISHFKMVQFSGVPQFDDCFIVVIPKNADEAPLFDLLTPDLRRMMSSTQAIQISAGGDAIAFSISLLTATQKNDVDERIRSLISESVRFSPYFFRK